MNKDQIEDLISKLDALIKLTAINVLKDKTPTERISILLDFGFEPKTIANLLGTKANIVRAIKSQRTKKSKTKTKTKTTKEKNLEKTIEK